MSDKPKLEDGYTVIPNKILMTQKLSVYEKIVLSLLKMHGMKKRKCFPSQRTLLKESGIDKRTLAKTIKTLENGFFITIEKKLGTVNKYKINDTLYHECENK